MTAKHTPGPWDVDEDERGPLVCHGETRDMIADTSSLGFRSVSENRANTNLIAAAPELLATLEKCIEMLEAMDRCYATRLNERDGEVLLEACAVVAKAKGEIK